MIKQFVKAYQIGSTVKFRLGKNTIQGRVDKVLKPGYEFKDTDSHAMRYLIHLDESSYIVVPHILIRQ